MMLFIMMCTKIDRVYQEKLKPKVQIEDEFISIMNKVIVYEYYF